MTAPLKCVFALKKLPESKPVVKRGETDVFTCHKRARDICQQYDEVP